MAQAQAEFTDYQGTGLGLVEMSHRSREFLAVVEESENLLRELLGIPAEYAVICEQGGGRGQFAAVPLNLLPEDGRADYFVTGHWSRCAYEECARRYGPAAAHVCTGHDADGRTTVDYAAMRATPGAAYAYCCLNETVNGLEMFTLPETGDVPLVADLSSDILTRPLEVSKFGALIFGVQKNLAPAGLTMTVVRRDLLGRARRYCPSVLDWAVLAQHQSLFNTPCMFSWYMALLNLRWIKAQGGVTAMERRNVEKSRLVYDYLDGSDFYHCPIAPQDRSRVNCVFRLSDESAQPRFLAAAAARRLVGLKGHKVLGGLRASLYNAMPPEGARVLVQFLRDFAAGRA